MDKIWVTPEMVKNYGTEFQQISNILKSVVEKYKKCMESNVHIAQAPIFAEDNQKMQMIFHDITQSIEAIDEYVNHCIQISESFSPPEECFQNVNFQ